MGYDAFPLQLPASILNAATRFAAEDGVSLSNWIAFAVAQKVGAVESAAEFFKRRAAGAQPGILHALLAAAPHREPDPGDELPPGF